MQIERLPTARGYSWTTEGIRLLLRQPLGLLASGFLALMLMSLPLIIPGIGVPLAVAIVPAIFVGLMKAIRAVDQGQNPNPAMLISVFTRDGKTVWQQLLVLGAVSAVLTVLVMGANTVLGGATMADFVLPGPDGEQPPDPTTLLLPFALFLVLYTPVQMALWYAPLFVAWHQVPVSKALFFSLVAVWRNRWAFVAMFIAWALVLIIGLGMLAGLASMLGLPPSLLAMIVSPLTMAAITAMYCSCWLTYRDVIR
ncbi:MAG: BPSS1780 family membrane protein [Burkholderiaceae bacterium]